VLEKLDDPSWRDVVLTQVIAARLPWVRALDERRVLHDWLAGSEGWQRETAYWVLHTVAETDGDRVASHLEQLTRRPQPWPARAWSILPRLRRGTRRKSSTFVCALCAAVSLNGTIFVSRTSLPSGIHGEPSRCSVPRLRARMASQRRTGILTIVRAGRIGWL